MAIDIRNRHRRTFYLGLRQASAVGITLLVFQLVICLLLLNLSIAESILLSLLTGVIAAATSYLVTLKLQKQRTEKVERIIRNIGRKQFEETGTENSGHQDELDILITRAVRTSKTIEHEIQRLNKIENYRKEFIGDISHELNSHFCHTGVRRNPAERSAGRQAGQPCLSEQGDASCDPAHLSDQGSDGDFASGDRRA